MLCAVHELTTAVTKALGMDTEFEALSNLVCEGKTSHIAKTAFVDMTGTHPTRLIDLFKMYVEEARPVEKNHA
ncbi:hypothetical protein UCREL1_10162 [Eutypa lata UCREL1]|uniref:Uncharacterized protein n=1 Tax=Eutypa lata (strain UCR-EL1) TaxID=1287681 RepID=M7SF99_EUTLA|nr:hypothetical protein UCREL1_10162 [Eutypa lata UCREL1]